MLSKKNLARYPAGYPVPVPIRPAPGIWFSDWPDIRQNQYPSASLVLIPSESTL
jgi:hypothetical protein